MQAGSLNGVGTDDSGIALGVGTDDSGWRPSGGWVLVDCKKMWTKKYHRQNKPMALTISGEDVRTWTCST